MTLLQHDGICGVIVALLFISQAPAQSGRINGAVRDSASGAPIAQALVMVGQRYSTKTGPDGDFAIANITPGDWRVLVSRSGYRTMEVGPLRVGATDAVQVTLRLLSNCDYVPARDSAVIADARLREASLRHLREMFQSFAKRSADNAAGAVHIWSTSMFGSGLVTLVDVQTRPKIEVWNWWFQESRSGRRSFGESTRTTLEMAGLCSDTLRVGHRFVCHVVMPDSAASRYIAAIRDTIAPALRDDSKPPLPGCDGRPGVQGDGLRVFLEWGNGQQRRSIEMSNSLHRFLPNHMVAAVDGVLTDLALRPDPFR